MSTRLYYRNTLIGDSGGVTVYELNEVQGTPDETVGMIINDTAFTPLTAFAIQVGTDLNTTSFPTSVHIPTVSGTLEYRWRLQRTATNTGVAVESSAYSTTQSTAGTHTHTFTWNPTWEAGDWIRVTFELRRTGGHGNVSADISTQNTNSWIDVVYSVVEDVSNVYVYNGTEWIQDTTKGYDGTSWVEGKLKVYDGTTWLE